MNEIKELMAAWDSVYASLRKEFPKASDEIIYQMSSDIMKKKLGL